jgi:hypothetical protein
LEKRDITDRSRAKDSEAEKLRDKYRERQRDSQTRGRRPEARARETYTRCLFDGISLHLGLGGGWFAVLKNVDNTKDIGQFAGRTVSGTWMYREFVLNVECARERERARARVRDEDRDTEKQRARETEREKHHGQRDREPEPETEFWTERQRQRDRERRVKYFGCYLRFDCPTLKKRNTPTPIIVNEDNLIFSKPSRGHGRWLLERWLLAALTWHWVWFKHKQLHDTRATHVDVQLVVCARPQPRDDWKSSTDRGEGRSHSVNMGECTCV